MIVVRDLSNEWLVVDDGKMTNSSSQIRETIHFTFDLQQYQGKHLRLSSPNKYYVFVNGKLTRSHVGALSLSVDSLKWLYPSDVVFAVHQDEFNPKTFTSQIVYWRKSAATTTVVNPSSYFRDFVVAAGLLLLIMFVALLRTNSKLLSSYFSVPRLLSLRESDDNPAQSRVAISSNIGFYFFASLLLSYFFLIVFTMLTSRYQIAAAFNHGSFSGAVGQWLSLSFILLLVFVAKMSITFSLASLFGIRSLSASHFFNWMRLVLLVSSILSVVAFAFFVNRKYEFNLYVTLVTIIAVLLVAWVVLAFFKLANRSQHTLFHLFSYICATEVIPLIIVIKVLFR